MILRAGTLKMQFSFYDYVTTRGETQSLRAPCGSVAALTLIDQLVGATDQLEVVLVHEVPRDGGAEQPAGAARRSRPRVHVLGV